MMWTDDPEFDFDRYESEQIERIERLPVCCCCKEHIQQEAALYYNDQWVCEDCEDDFFREVIKEDYLVPVEDD